MNRVTTIFTILLLTVTLPLFAEEKYYSDSRQGYSGWGLATYSGIGIDDDIITLTCSNIKNSLPGHTYLGNVSKLTKNQQFLVRKALLEYELEPDECYNVLIGDNLNYPTIIIVKITSVKDEKNFSYAWWGIGVYKKN